MKKSDTYLFHYGSGRDVHFGRLYVIVILLISLFISSCNPTKYVPEGESLLNENHINVNKEGIKKSELVPYIKQVPNKQIFGRKFYLGLYNLSNINKEKWPNKWLREIGEPPVIFDQSEATKSKEQIKSYVDSKGYFDGIVNDTVKTKNKKSDVYYSVNLRRPYTIHNLTYEIADTNIKNLCYFDSVNCLIVRGKPYDVDVLQSERLRFERFIREHGFYGFSNDFISFGVDSTVGDRQVDIKYKVKNFSKVDASNRVVSSPFAVYTVKNIFIYPDYDPKEALAQGEKYLESMDTTFYNGYYFVTSQKNQEIKYDLILKSLYITAGSVYNVTNTEQTQSHLRNLKVYRLVNINFTDAKENENLQGIELFLNCNIQLTVLGLQSYKFEVEGTNSAGNLGGAVNLVYQHINLFHGAELLSMSVKGAYAVYKVTNSTNDVSPVKISNPKPFKGAVEYGFETSLKFPKFILPFFKSVAFIEKYNPSTNLAASFDYQSMPFYTRSLANASFGYYWKAPKYQEHYFNPLMLNYINVLKISPEFQQRIDTSSYQASSYKDVLILGGNYSFIFRNQIKNSKDYWFLRINAETAGNAVNLFKSLTGAKKIQDTIRNTEGVITDILKSHKILGLPFAQYVRADLDLRYYYKFNDASSIAYRAFIGVGIPYGNSREIPFERQYYGGGANGIRAWQVRTLGPGSYNPNADTTVSKVFLNETADIKLEANAEYRFKLFWIVESAIFLDAGNIWTFNYDKARDGSQFAFRKFYKDIAVGTGTGFRFNFPFVTARVDIGVKLRDPLNTRPGAAEGLTSPGSKWIFLNGPYTRHDFTIVFGIGYPF